MSPQTIKLIAMAFSMKKEIKIIAYTLLVIMLIPVLSVIILTQAGINLVSDALASHDTQNAQVDIHDPAMAKDGDTFYLYSTGPGITFYSSKDRIHWAARGQVFAKAPSWAQAVAATFNGPITASRHLFTPSTTLR